MMIEWQETEARQFLMGYCLLFIAWYRSRHLQLDAAAAVASTDRVTRPRTLPRRSPQYTAVHLEVWRNILLRTDYTCRDHDRAELFNSRHFNTSLKRISAPSPNCIIGIYAGLLNKPFYHLNSYQRAWKYKVTMYLISIPTGPPL